MQVWQSTSCTASTAAKREQRQPTHRSSSSNTIQPGHQGEKGPGDQCPPVATKGHWTQAARLKEKTRGFCRMWWPRMKRSRPFIKRRWKETLKQAGLDTARKHNLLAGLRPGIRWNSLVSLIWDYAIRQYCLNEYQTSRKVTESVISVAFHNLQGPDDFSGKWNK